MLTCKLLRVYTNSFCWSNYHRDKWAYWLIWLKQSERILSRNKTWTFICQWHEHLFVSVVLVKCLISQYLSSSLKLTYFFFWQELLAIGPPLWLVCCPSTLVVCALMGNKVTYFPPIFCRVIPFYKFPNQTHFQRKQKINTYNNNDFLC